MKRFSRANTLRVRLVLWSMAVNALLLMAFGGGIWLVLRQVQDHQVNDTLQLSASQLASVIDANNGQLTAPPDDVASLTSRGVFAWIVNTAGQVDMVIGAASKLALPNMVSDFQDTLDAQNSSIRLYRYPLTENNGQIIIGMSLEPTERTQKTVLFILAATIPLALLVSAAGSIFLASRALSPIAAITAQAKRISRENLAERLAFNSGDEVGQLAQTFDSMLDRLQAAFEHERQFIGNVSHELRTPLSMLKAQISLALSRPRDAAVLTQMMDAMDGDVDRMARLVERMLTLIRTEATPIHLAAVNLSDLLSGLLSQMEPLAAEGQITLRLESPAETLVAGDADQLIQLFLNLVDNALKYSSTGGQVRIVIKSCGIEWQIDVSDTGVGIAREVQSHLFDRFYRSDPSRTRQTGGVGLGLSIAQAIVGQHGGRITVQSELGQGSTFSVFLPLFSRSST